MKRENRKAWPKLVRKEWDFPVVPEDYGTDDLRLKVNDCTCSGSGTPQVDPPPTQGDACLVDEYTHCGTNGLTYDEIAAGTHPVVYMRAWDGLSNPDNIFVFDGLGGACYTKTDQIACEDAQGRLLGLDDWRKLDTDLNNVVPCLQKICNQYLEKGYGDKFEECDWTVSPFLLNVGAEATVEEGLIQSPYGCSWDAVNRNDDDWFEFFPTGGLSGRAISITIEENEGEQRTGYIDVVNRVVSKKAPVGTTVGTIEIIQASGAAPTVCPGHPPLLDTYAISGQVTEAYHLIPLCVFAFPFDTSVLGVLAKFADCAWSKSLTSPTRSATLTLGTTVDGVKCWKLAVSYQTLPCPWTAWYYKPTGLTPVGDYTPEPVGINGAPFSGTTGTITIS